MGHLNLSLRAKLLIASASALVVTVLVLILFNYFSMHNSSMNLYKNIQNRVTDNIATILGKDFDKYTSGLTMLAKSMNAETTKELIEKYEKAFIETKNPHANGPMQFEPMWFKGQLYTWKWDCWIRIPVAFSLAGKPFGT